jgi:hypothetical protein
VSIVIVDVWQTRRTLREVNDGFMSAANSSGGHHALTNVTNAYAIWMAEEQMNMMKALEKIAGRQRRMKGSREIVCHRCGTECVLPAGALVDATVCVGCVQRLGDPPRRHDGPARAARMAAEWSSKGAVRGPGYGVVTCPHCDEECVVEVGEAARTGCGACLRPLGAGPLVREDLAARDAAPEAHVETADEDEPVPRYTLRWSNDAATPRAAEEAAW